MQDYRENLSARGHAHLCAKPEALNGKPHAGLATRCHLLPKRPAFSFQDIFASYDR